MRRKYLIYGGSFNPTHYAHITMARYVKNMYKFDEVIFMPVYKHPWNKELIHWKHRLNMLELSLTDNNCEDMSISTFEIDNKLVGNTYRNLQLFFEANPEIKEGRPYFMIGSDQANIIHKWEDWLSLLDIIPFIVVERKTLTGSLGYRTVTSTKPIDTWINNPPHLVVETPLEYDIDVISSTKIRSRIKAGKSVGSLSVKTMSYINKHNLYKGSKENERFIPIQN